MYETSTDGKILFIRHGTTDYNKVLFSDPTNKETHKVNENYIDCPLSIDGINDCHPSAEILLNLNIKYVFVSPLLRCLETAELLLGRHKNSNQMEIFVHPFIAEIVSSCHDISTNIKVKKEKYNLNSDLKFNWKYFEETFREIKDQEAFFLNFIDNPDKKQISSLMDKYKNSPEPGLISQILGNFWKKNQRPESINSLNIRCKLFKKFIQGFIDDKNISEDEKILVITHSAVIRLTSSLLATELSKIENYPSDCYTPKNCEILSILEFKN